MQNTLIYLIGFPGFGKLTIARQIATATGARVVDNHLINNPIFNIIDLPDGGHVPNEAWPLIRQIRATVFMAIETISPPRFSFIFTNLILANDAVDRQIYDDVARIAQTRQARFIPVRLLCNQEENMRRMAEPARRERLKPTRPEILHRLANKKLIDVTHDNVLDLDVTHLTVQQSVDAILKHAEAV